MLEQSFKDQLSSLFQGLKNNYTFKISVPDLHPEKENLFSLLNDVASCSEKLTSEIIESENFEFRIEKNYQPLSIIFKTVPTGHEFTSLLLAVLNADGIGKNLPDEAVIQKIKAIKGKVEIKSYISLTCTNCPDVVQALNIISLYNPDITHQIIDGALFQKEVEKLNIQAVPAVYVNDTLLHIGRATLGELLSKLEELVGTNETTISSVEKEYDVIVAGGGPAGISAAIYSARKGFKVALIAEKTGGQVTETVAIENLISVPQTTGTQLASDLKEHLKNYPVDIYENRKIVKTELIDGMKLIHSSMGETLKAPALIIATGASWRRLNVPGESQYIGSGVAFCTHCDGPFYKNKKVVVVGGGNSGLEAAIDLSAIASQVTVLEFNDTLKGDKVLQHKLAELKNVEIITHAQTLNIEGDGKKVTALQYKNRTTEATEALITDGVFVQIGLTANSQPFKDLLETNTLGEISIDAHCRTQVPGIYAAGDVSTVPYKQIVIAMGEGAKAALSAFEDKIKGAI